MLRIYIIIAIGILLNVGIVNAQQPHRDWTSYYGGNLTYISRIYYDAPRSAVYIMGITADSVGIATPGTHKPSIGTLSPALIPSNINFWQYDGFIAKFDLNGTRLWGTYFGGNKKDNPGNMVVDNSGNIIVIGNTFSQDNIATAGSFQQYTVADTGYPFIMKFDSLGTKLWGTYYSALDSNGQLQLLPVNIDSLNNIFIGGIGGNAPNETTSGSYRPNASSNADAYLVKFDSAGNRQYGTYIGGAEGDSGDELKIDRQGNILFLGVTQSDTGIATAGTLQPLKSTGSGVPTTFLQKYNAGGTRLWGTYINGTLPLSLTTDEGGNSYIFLSTQENLPFATAGTHDISYNGGYDFFILKLDPTGNLVWGTYFGGNFDDYYLVEAGLDPTPINSKTRIQYSTSDHALYIAGVTTSTTDLSYACPYQGYAPDRKGLLAKFDTSGHLVWSTYYNEGIYDLAISEGRADSTQNEIFFVSRTAQNGLATPGSFQPSKGTATRAGLFGKFSDYSTCTDTTLLHIARVADTLRTAPGYSSYMWYRNGGTPLATAVGNRYKLKPSDTSGYIYLAATSICNCPFKSDTFYLSPTTGIGPLASGTPLAMYPNPAQQQVSISLPTGFYNGTLSIVDVYGREVYNSVVKANNQSFISVPLQMYPKGIYYVRLYADNFSFGGKLIIR